MTYLNSLHIPYTAGRICHVYVVVGQVGYTGATGVAGDTGLFFIGLFQHVYTA